MKGELRKSPLTIPAHTHLLIRAAVIRGGEPITAIAARFAVSDRTVENSTTIDLPKIRCPDCGGLVIPPCLKCCTPPKLKGSPNYVDAR